MWDQTDGCAKQYRCSIAYYLMYFLSKSYQIILDRDIDTPGHGKDVVDGFNAVQKRYLAICFIIRSTPENYKIDSKRMRDDDMNKKEEVSFAEECKRSLYFQDAFFTKGDKKHVKRKAKACSNQKYYWVHKEEDIFFNGIQAVYKILNNQDKVKMNQFYQIRCDPYLDKGFYAM